MNEPSRTNPAFTQEIDLGNILTLEQILAKAPWYTLLTSEDQQLVQRTSSEKIVSEGEFVVRVGDPSTYWMGVVNGLLRMYVVSSDGRETVLSCIADGEWCGEGSLLKQERRRYGATALQNSRVALVPLETFLHLREVSVLFNHYLQDIMNARIGSLIARLEAERLLSPERRVANNVATLCRSKRGIQDMRLDIPQHDLAMICGLSRPRTNVALGVLEDMGYIHIEFRSLKVLNLIALTAYGDAAN